MKFFLTTLLSLWCVFAWVTYGILVGIGLEDFGWLEVIFMPVLFFIR